jgi:hypothetical protein
MSASRGPRAKGRGLRAKGRGLRAEGRGGSAALATPSSLSPRQRGEGWGEGRTLDTWASGEPDRESRPSPRPSPPAGGEGGSSLQAPRTSRDSLQLRELRARIACRIDLGMRLRDFAFFVDHVGDAARIFVFGRISGAVGETDLPVDVAQEGEWEVELLGESLVVRRLVETDPENAGVLLLVLFDEVPEPGPFFRSAGCIGLRVKPEHDLAATQVAQADVILFMIQHIEVGGLLARLEHFSSSSKQHLQHSANGHGVIVVAA